MTLVINPESAAGFVERGLEPDTGQHVEQRALGAAVTDVVGGDNRKAGVIGKVGELAVGALLGGVQMALQIDEEIALAENRAQAIAEREWIVAAREPHRER